MKKGLFLLTISLFLTSLTFAEGGNYKITDQQVDQMFAGSTELVLNLDNDFQPVESNMLLVTAKEKDRVVAGILGILFGAFGVHRAYSGSPFKVWGVYAGVTVCTAGFLSPLPGILGLIDAIMIFMGTDEEYQSKWVGSTKLFNF